MHNNKKKKYEHPCRKDCMLRVGKGCLIKVAHHIVSGNNSVSCSEEDVGSKVSSTNFYELCT